MEITFYLALAAVIFAVIGYLIGAGKISLRPSTWLVMFIIIALPFLLNLLIWLYAGTTPETNVPDVMGLQSNAAISKLEEANLEGEIAGVSFSNKPGGTVISQLPEAGRRVKIGRIIGLIVSASESSINVPNLIGKTSDEAQSMLSPYGLVIGQVMAQSSSVAPGIIIEQSPAPGSVAHKGSGITITVSSGPGEEEEE